MVKHCSTSLTNTFRKGDITLHTHTQKPSLAHFVSKEKGKRGHLAESPHTHTVPVGSSSVFLLSPKGFIQSLRLQVKRLSRRQQKRSSSPLAAKRQIASRGWDCSKKMRNPSGMSRNHGGNEDGGLLLWLWEGNQFPQPPQLPLPVE